MNSIYTIRSLFAFSVVLMCQQASMALSENDLRGPISPSVKPAQTIQSTSPEPVTTPAASAVASPATPGMAGLSAPGADALMNRDMLLVAPSKESKQQPPVPLGTLAGNAVNLRVLRSDITFAKFHGVLVNITNGANRPLVLDGDKATVLLGGKTYPAASVQLIQQAIIAPHKTSRDFEDILTKILPAAASIGAIPTIEDIRESQRPVLERYGPDELRRKIEFTRFGRRILWTNQRVEGIMYFNTPDDLKGGQIVIPATTLFDAKDTSTLTGAL